MAKRCASGLNAKRPNGGLNMMETQESVITDLADSTQSVEETGDGALEDTKTNAPADSNRGVGAIVGVMTSGFSIAAVAGFIAGFVTGFAVARLSAPQPSPRWQVWR